ncbi:MAG: thioredoxin domain-containing protein [Candidatus Melainabacteria bacterium]|nr:thioredoxin domain-containing protein [Candidatus Melainabacteria bacterium]
MKLKTLLGIIAAVALSALAINLIFFDKGPQPAAFKPSVNVVEVTDANFEAEILDSKLPVVIDFNATWCAPCKQYKPVFHKVADQYVGKVKFISIDVDKAPAVAALFGLKSIPATVFLSEANGIINGAGAQGALQEADLKKMLDLCLQPDAKLIPLFQKRPVAPNPPKNDGTKPDAPKDDAPAVDAPKDATPAVDAPKEVVPAVDHLRIDINKEPQADAPKPGAAETADPKPPELEPKP